METVMKNGTKFEVREVYNEGGKTVERIIKEYIGSLIASGQIKGSELCDADS